MKEQKKRNNQEKNDPTKIPIQPIRKCLQTQNNMGFIDEENGVVRRKKNKSEREKVGVGEN